MWCGSVRFWEVLFFFFFFLWEQSKCDSTNAFTSVLCISQRRSEQTISSVPSIKDSIQIGRLKYPDPYLLMRTRIRSQKRRPEKDGELLKKLLLFFFKEKSTRISPIALGLCAQPQRLQLEF